MGQLTLLAVFAHPDDEAFGTGGTLARYAGEGCRVYLVTATRGEAGQISDSSLATEANLPAVRERELRCACEAYGAEPPRFLDYLDGQLTSVHQGQAVGKLVRIIRELRPQVVVTFGPEGIYGHYDHIAVHRWATLAAELAADDTCFPDQLQGECRLHRPSKLYYRVFSNATVSRLAAGGMKSVMMDGVPFPFVGYDPDQITTVIDVGPYTEAKRRGILCHATQIAPDQRSQGALEDMLGDEEFCTEHYILARSDVGFAETVERDLFRGLRASLCE